MSVLAQILESKRAEVELAKVTRPIGALERTEAFTAPCVSLSAYVRREDKQGIIAEVKRKSPSRGSMPSDFSVEELSVGYMQAGASALSVLTDAPFFGGSNEDLVTARKFNYCPILRKEFVIDEYQVIEARSLGADAVLLIAAALSPEQTRSLAGLARSLGMEALLEVHTPEELRQHRGSRADLVGVNNRSLEDLSVDPERSLKMAPELPEDAVRVSESGLRDADTILRLRERGFSGFLIGESFMATDDPPAACGALIRQLEARA